MPLRLARRVHELDCEIDALCRCVGAIRGHDVLFAHDGRGTLDQQTRALIVVGHDALADEDAFAGFQFDLERHRPLLTIDESASPYDSRNENGGAKAPPLPRNRSDWSYWNRRSTLRSACAANDSAVEESC